MYVLSMQKIFTKQQRTQNGALRNTTEGESLPKTTEKVLSMRIKVVKNSVPYTNNTNNVERSILSLKCRAPI